MEIYCRHEIQPCWRLDWEIKFIRCGEAGDINLTSANTLRVRYIDINSSLVSSKLDYWRPDGFYKLLRNLNCFYSEVWVGRGWWPVLDLTRFLCKNDGWLLITDAGESWFAWYRGRRRPSYNWFPIVEWGRAGQDQGARAQNNIIKTVSRAPVSSSEPKWHCLLVNTK